MPNTLEAQGLLTPTREDTGLFTSDGQDALLYSAQSEDPPLSSTDFHPCKQFPLDGCSALLRKGSTTTSTAINVDHSQDDPDVTRTKATSPKYEYSPPRRFNIWNVLPALVTTILCAGTASALVAWLITRRVTPTDDTSFRGALVAFEGRLNDVSWTGILAHVLGIDQDDSGASSPDTTSETIMYGLAISSVAAHLVSFTLPFTLSTFAYLLASMWVQAQTRGHVEDLPTPTQYGHLLGLCGSFGPMGIYDAGKYLSHGRRTRPAASTALIAAFFASLVALMLNYLLSLADLWLHTTVKTLSYEFTTPIAEDLLPALGTNINSTTCPGPSPFTLGGDLYSNCQHLPLNDSSIDMFWGDANLVNEGAAVLGNTSMSSQVQIIDNLATLLPKNLPNGVKNLVFNTFAMNATCAPVTDCQYNVLLFEQMYFLACAAFTPPFTLETQVQDIQSMLDQLDASTNALILQSGTPEVAGKTGGYTLNSTLNPVGILVTLHYDQRTTANVPIDLPSSQPGWYISGGDSQFYLGRCILDVWNLSISYTAPPDGSAAPSFRIASGRPATRTDFNTTSALLGAIDAAYGAVLASRLTTSLQGSLNVSPDEFNHLLAGNLSQGILALAAPLTARIAAGQGDAVTSATVSRYPLAPLCAVLALTYGYSLLALGIGITVFLLPSRMINGLEREDKPIRELDVAHSRLTNARMCISDCFDDDSLAEESQRLGIGPTNKCGDKLKVGLIRL